MGRDLHYVPGDFYRVDDRTGFPERAKRTRKEWTNLIVHRDRWEYRHPQDFVKGVFDDQTVPEPRPLPSVDPMVGAAQFLLVAPPGTPAIPGGFSSGFSSGFSIPIPAVPGFIPGAIFDMNPLNTIVNYVYPAGYGT